MENDKNDRTETSEVPVVGYKLSDKKQNVEIREKFKKNVKLYRVASKGHLFNMDK